MSETKLEFKARYDRKFERLTQETADMRNQLFQAKLENVRLKKELDGFKNAGQVK